MKTFNEFLNENIEAGNDYISVSSLREGDIELYIEKGSVAGVNGEISINIMKKGKPLEEITVSMNDMIQLGKWIQQKCK